MDVVPKVVTFKDASPGIVRKVALKPLGTATIEVSIGALMPPFKVLSDPVVTLSDRILFLQIELESFHSQSVQGFRGLLCAQVGLMSQTFLS
jgi:hypothetical protein